MFAFVTTVPQLKNFLISIRKVLSELRKRAMRSGVDMQAVKRTPSEHFILTNAAFLCKWRSVSTLYYILLLLHLFTVTFLYNFWKTNYAR